MKNLVSFKLFEQIDSTKRNIIIEVIDELNSITEFPINTELLKRWSTKLKSVGLRPADIDAAIYDTKKHQQYLVDGPSAPGGGGNGALKDLQRLVAKHSRHTSNQ